jgi:predicted enzyme related to lactoylglutathione lyase
MTETETTTYAPGTPMWVDLASPDLEASRSFYGSLFGWDAFVTPDPEAGGYTIFLQNGKEVAGLGPQFHPDQPSAWATYVCTADADATAQKVQEAGGQVVVPPMDVMDQGRMAVFVDSTGAHFCVWQPRKHQGAQLVNQPYGFTWNELATRDIDGAKSFYGQVFGWTEQTHVMEGAPPYTEWKLNERSIAGAMPMDDRNPPAVPPHWLTYFAVENTDQTVAKVQELGGTVLVPPMDIPQGRFAVLADNHGANFAVIAMPSQ